MADIFNNEKRSEIMRKVKSKKNKSTELRLIDIFKQNGITGWKRNYPVKGHPDFVFLKEKVAVFVDGCFWHGHDCPRGQRPQTNADFWNQKIDRNVIRDKSDVSLLESLGWRVLIVWECEIKKKNEAVLLSRVKEFLLHSTNTIQNS